jgi:EAL domain-containing protein (putative c-di-GMP-specific phosphodiesterase class I)
VNFSAAQLRSPDLDKMIAKVLKETGLPAERLEIEVPESLFLRDSSDVMEVLRRVKALGVRVAMDDFGAGYTGLASLAQFPFDKIKIDRNFVGQLTEDADVAAIVAAIVALGRTLSVDVTAEGVETSEQVTLLKAAGCSIVQGFLFGVPKRQTAAAREPSANTTQQPTGTAGS